MPQRRHAMLLLGAVALLMSTAHAELSARTAASLDAALAAEGRPEADRERDRNRKPKETLEFMRFDDEMTVLELIPGGGWYSRLLAPALADHGKYYVSIGTRRLTEGLLNDPAYAHVEVLPFDAIGEREGRRVGIKEFTFGVDDVDLVLTFRNLHNFTERGRARMNEAAFAALKPGGLYGVVDHTRRHMEPDWSENWRRMDPVAMIIEIQAAGFELVAASDLHFRPDDELEYEVGRASVTGNTDRFTLLFHKPE
ncbi:MAG: methyltransferase [Pseudomonadota bacterium]|nr:methyltransferase [Pseudomonadota bacterium]